MKRDLIDRSELPTMRIEIPEVLDDKTCKIIEAVIQGVRLAIDSAPAVDAEPVRHGTWKHIKKHLWHKNRKGEIDMWYVDHGFHNGPGCEICGLSFCEHCEPNWAEDECRIGYYVCSECEQPTKTGDSNYCPNCGAKMDAKTQEEE